MTAMMTGEKLRAVRKMMDMSQTEFGGLLGYTKASIRLMEHNKLEIRNSVALACAALAMGIRFYDGPQ